MRPDRGSTVQGVLDPARESARGVLEIAGDALGQADLHRRHGRVSDLIGLTVEATGLEAEVGEVCSIDTGRGRSEAGYDRVDDLRVALRDREVGLQH